MDGSRFDGFARTLAAGATRRQALLGVTGGAMASLLGLGGVEDAAAGCVKPGKKGCKGSQNKKCCTGATCQGGTKNKEGKCKCKGGTKQCGSTCVNTKTDKQHCGGCNKKCKGQNTCKNGVCTSKLGCKKGQNVCSDPDVDPTNPPRCPGADGENCFCLTSVDGIAFCSDSSAGDCADCTSSADCPAGQRCTDVGGVNCNDCGPSGRACLIASCGGVSGAGAGRSGPRPLFLR